jgi:hypothetical protein
MRNPATISRTINIAVLIEIGCITYGLYLPSAVLSVLYVLSGLCIAFCFLYRQEAVKTAKHVRKHRIFLFIPLLLALVFFGWRWMVEEPLSYRAADMLPVIQTMCERWLLGEWSHVYDPIPEIWHGMIPVYLPAMWLPYSIPVALGIDVRWLSIISLFLVYLMLLRHMRFVKQQWPVIAGACLLLCWILSGDCGLIPFSEEGLVILYYTFLVLAIRNKNPWLIGIAAALCLLSRYALIGWLPAMGIYYCWKKEWKSLLRISLAATALCLLLIIPFGWKNFQSLLSLPASYIDFAERVWHDSPEVFTGSVGLARFFGPGNIATQHWLLILLSLTLPSIAMLLLLRFAGKLAINKENIPLAVLKLTLLVFFSMIDVPYQYLFYTASFATLFMAIDGERN